MSTNANIADHGWQTVAIPFVAGLETKMAQAVIPAVKLSVLENGVFTKAGSVKKRPGYDAVRDWATVGEVIGAKRGLLTLSSDLALVTDRAVYSRTGGEWQSRGEYLAATVENWEVAHANRNQLAADVAVTNNVAVVVWKYTANSLYFQCFDATTRAALSAVTALATATADFPSALALGANVLLFFADTSTNNLSARVIRTAALAASIATAVVVTVRSDLDASRFYSVTNMDANTGLIVWRSDHSVLGAATNICQCRVNSAGTTSAAVEVVANIPDHNPAIAYSALADQICIVYSIAAGSSWQVIIDVSSTLINAPTDLGLQGERVAVAALPPAEYTATNAFVIALQMNGATADVRSVNLVLNGDLTTVLVRHCTISSQGFTLANRACFMLGHESRTGLQSAYYVYDSAGRCMGLLESGTALGRASSGELPHLSGGFMSLLFQRQLSVDQYTAQYAHTGIKLHKFSDTGAVRSAEFSAATYMSGCQLWAYDGNAPVEAGMHMFPDVKAADLSEQDTAGKLLTIGQYNYRVYYEWYSATGERIRSLPMQRSITTVYGTHSAGTVTLKIPTQRHTLKSESYGRQAELSVVVYRSAKNTSDVYYRVSSPDPATAGAANGYILNSFALDVCADFVDNISDAALVAGNYERDYFSVGELLNFPVPGPEVLYATKNRLYLAGGGVPRGTVLPSKEHVPGDAVAFAEELEVQPSTDAITALCALDESMVAFTSTAAYFIGGEGLDNTGGGQQFTIGRITSDVGCSDVGIAVLVPGGVMFKSSKGIYAIDQQSTVKYVGAPVESSNGLLIRSVNVIPDTNQVVFLCDGGDTLMYDYLYGQWGNFTQHRGIASVVFGHDYAYLRNDGIVYVRNADSYVDAGSPVILRIRTGRYRPDDMQGFFQLGVFAVLGEYKSPHKLAVRTFYNRSNVYSSEVTWDPTTVLNTSVWGGGEGTGIVWGSSSAWGGSGGEPDYHFERRPRRQKCSEVAFEFQDIITDTAGASFELTELLLKIKVRSGINRLSPQRKV